LIKIAELTKELDVHVNTVYKMIKQGMPHYKLEKDYRFDIEEVKNWLKERNNKRGD
jgi:excisionase family DNA binding protein